MLTSFPILALQLTQIKVERALLSWIWHRRIRKLKRMKWEADEAARKIAGNKAKKKRMVSNTTAHLSRPTHAPLLTLVMCACFGGRCFRSFRALEIRTRRIS